jgi:hypothetical protein
MAEPDMSSTASWWLKIERANKHLSELEDAVRRYSDSVPYEAVGGVHDEHDRHDIAYSLRITRKSDVEIAAIVGDTAHNARSALDHTAVALASRKRHRAAAFPIEVTEDIWLKDGRRYCSRDHRARRSYRSRVEGMDPRAQAIIKAAQPYNHGGEAHILAVLSKLENADKHQRSVITASVISDAVVGVHLGGIAKLTLGFPGQHEDRTAVMSVILASGGRCVRPEPDMPVVPLDDEMRRFVESVPFGEVNVEPTATVTVAVKTREKGESFDAIPLLKLAIGEVSKILRDLEPFVHQGISTPP